MPDLKYSYQTTFINQPLINILLDSQLFASALVLLFLKDPKRGAMETYDSVATEQHTNRLISSGCGMLILIFSVLRYSPALLWTMIVAVILTSPPWKAILPFINNFELSSGCLVSHFCRCFFNSLRNRNVTKAAEHLNIAKSAVSKRLASLEHKLGIKLINRTTRMSSITETGQRYYQRSKLILDEVEELNSQTSSSKRAFTGTLNIAVPLSFALGHLAPALDLFIQQHTDLKWNINFSVQKIDIVEQGVDSAFRGKT